MLKPIVGALLAGCLAIPGIVTAQDDAITNARAGSVSRAVQLSDAELGEITAGYIQVLLTLPNPTRFEFVRGDSFIFVNALTQPGPFGASLVATKGSTLILKCFGSLC